jgi:ubiquinone biosynthesis protein UbiJ
MTTNEPTKVSLADILEAVSGLSRQLEALDRRLDTINQRIVVLEEQVDLAEADEQQWDEAFAGSQEALARLADEAKSERQAGRARALDPDLL